MKIETREIYRCDHCKKIYLRKKACIDHEPKCKKNPINFQKCLDGCSHLCKKTITYYYDAYNGECEGEKELLYCSAKKEFVYPFWVGNPLHPEDMEDEIPNEVMPSECDHFK